MFAYYVNEPSQYGVVKFDDVGEPIDLVEKPTQFLSNWTITGLYFYDLPFGYTLVAFQGINLFFRKQS